MARSFAGTLSLWFTSLLLLGVAPYTGPSRVDAQHAFLRGDVNADGRLSISDPLMLRRVLFGTDQDVPEGEGHFPCEDAADVNDDGEATITDEIRLAWFIFETPPPGTNPPAAPYPGVGTDATEDSIGCEGYEVIEPIQTDDLVQLGDVSGAPGELVKIPVYVTNSVALEGLQLVVAYDPQVIEIRRVDAGNGDNMESALHWSGTFYATIATPEHSHGKWFSVIPYPDKGIFTVSLIPYLADGSLDMPPGEDTLAFYILGTIQGTAQDGTAVSLQPTNGPDGSGFGHVGLRNEFTYRGEARYFSTEPRLEGAILQIVVDQTFFRGDSNRDDKVDLSDAEFTLGYLFLGASAPVCMDAADANDDGSLDIADPVYTLDFLFLGGRPFPPPYPEKGHETTTEDSLRCLPSV